MHFVFLQGCLIKCGMVNRYYGLIAYIDACILERAYEIAGLIDGCNHFQVTENTTQTQLKLEI